MIKSRRGRAIILTQLLFFVRPLTESTYIMFKSNPDYDAANYFSSLNPMAKRIVVETSALQSTQAEKWKDLKYSDQSDLITQTFMKPGITEKYPNISSSPDQICFPKLKINSGQKFVFEDDVANRRAGRSWRDEHSAPFMWESQSQLNLSYILQEAPAETPNEEEIKSEDVLPQCETTNTNIVEPEQIKSQNCKPKDEVMKRSHSKKKAAPPIPTPVSIPQEKEISSAKQTINTQQLHSPLVTSPDSDSNEEAGIPKTGFDFLDNW